MNDLSLRRPGLTATFSLITSLAMHQRNMPKPESVLKKP
ncbi:hypothetical protein BH09BAC4_BH09BAC4_36560 [soil metagenome]